MPSAASWAFVKPATWAVPSEAKSSVSAATWAVVSEAIWLPASAARSPFSAVMLLPRACSWAGLRPATWAEVRAATSAVSIEPGAKMAVASARTWATLSWL